MTVFAISKKHISFLLEGRSFQTACCKVYGWCPHTTHRKGTAMAHLFRGLYDHWKLLVNYMCSHNIFLDYDFRWSYKPSNRRHM